MIDHLVGKPSPSWKRNQVVLVILFWLWRILRGTSGPPRILWLRNLNRLLSHFTPWQIILTTLTTVYGLRNIDKILGLSAPEPLARLYSPSYYRATWITTGLDAGFATAMSIRPKWLRDLCSVLFSVYYIVYATEGDEKLRRFRAVPTVEMLRCTWEKTTNPYLRLISQLPHVSIRRKIVLPRPRSSRYDRPISAFLFFHPPKSELSKATELILDFPGGGFVSMSPEHHEERLRMWAVTSGRPVLSIDYGKAPEYPYPFAIDEAFDVYRILVESVGSLIGMSGKSLDIILSGDSAGAALTVNVVLKILESHDEPPGQSTYPTTPLPKPLAVVLNYPALDFNFTSWMTEENLRVLRSEQSTGNLFGLKELAAQKDHLQHVSPLSMVADEPNPTSQRKGLRRQTSWKDTLKTWTGGQGPLPTDSQSDMTSRRSMPALPSLQSLKVDVGGNGNRHLREKDLPIEARIRYFYSPIPGSPIPVPQMILTSEQKAIDASTAARGKEMIGTRLTMTSRTGYFQDRIVSPSMMRAMAILYVGPHRNPDFATDYYLSPILAPQHLLAQFPPLLMQCGEKDPFVDDTVIFAGRIREAKRVRKAELDLALSGKSARFGEGLRMSDGSSRQDGSRSRLEQERNRLSRETDEDWVQMVLFSEWSHGYLQMPTLMREARTVIEDQALWMDDAFHGFSRVEPHFEGTDDCGPARSRSTEREESGITFGAKGAGKQRPEARHEQDSNVTGCAEDGGTRRSVSGNFGNDGADSVHNIEAPKSILSRQPGQTITETELMRRRRMLDSHIFQ